MNHFEQGWNSAHGLFYLPHPYNDPLDKKLRISQLFAFFSIWSVLYGARPGRHNFLICQVNGLSDISLIFFLRFSSNPLFSTKSLYLVKLFIFTLFQGHMILNL